MFRLLTISVVIVLMAAMLVVADNSVRTLDPSTLQSIQPQPILLQPVAIDGVPVSEIGPDSSPLLSPELACDGYWQGPISFFYPGWIYGNEYYAIYQDPSETGCSNTYPFIVNEVNWYIYSQVATTFDLQPMIWDYSSPDVIGGVLLAGPVYSISIPDAGVWLLSLPFPSGCLVNSPYYAGVYIPTNLGPNIIDIVVDDGVIVPPRSNATYNDYGSGWLDLVDDVGFLWNVVLWSEGETFPGCTDPNCVEVSSMTAYVGQQDVEIPILIDNDVDLNALVVPIKIETISGTASITSARLEYRDRITGSVLELHICNQREDGDNACSNYPLVGSNCGIDYPVSAMPEAFIFGAAKIVDALPAGQDADGSLVLVVDIGPGEGTMFIDTTCVYPANRLEYIDSYSQSIKPSFQPGFITVGPPTEWDTLPEFFYSIPELHDSAAAGEVVEGATVRVLGEYVSPDIDILVTSYLEYLRDQPAPPNSSLLLDGPEPNSDYFYGGRMIITGTVQFDITPYPSYGTDTLVITLSPTKFEYLLPGLPAPPTPPTGSIQLEGTNNYRESAAPDCDSCKFAILVSSMGGIHPAPLARPKPTYWENIVNLRRYKIDSAGYCEEDVFVHYADGNSDNEAEIPAASIEPCTQAAIDATHTTIAQRIADRKAKCLAAGKKITVQKMFTNHGSDGAGVCLMGDEYLSPAELTAMQQRLIDAGCNTLIDEFITCYGGDMLNGLEDLDNKNNTQIHANSAAPDYGCGISPSTGGHEYLNKKIECLAAGGSYEECVREAERAYREALEEEYNDDLARKQALEERIAELEESLEGLELLKQLGLISEELYQAWLAHLNKLLEELREQLAKVEQYIADEAKQLGLDDEDGEGEGSPSWVKHTFHKYCEWKEFVVEPGGQLVIDFSGDDGCGNVTVWEKQEDGTWKRVKIWNWNLPESIGFSPEYEERVIDVPETSTGIYRIHNDNGEFTIFVESFNGRQAFTADPSNGAEYAGFSIGATDTSEAEFGFYTGATHLTTGTNLEGFNLDHVPQAISTSIGVGTYIAYYVAEANNGWWDNMEVVMNILEVYQPGMLTITWTGLQDTIATLMIDTVGEYHVHLGPVPAPGENHITFTTTPSGASFVWDAWSLRTLVPANVLDPMIRIGTTEGSPLGQLEFVSITIEDNPLQMGGYDFLLAYDASVLVFMEATPGQLLPDCEWEYFTYRYGADGNCGDACPSGLLRIMAIADINNGAVHPSCYGPPDTDPYELVRMFFLVTDDRTFECQYVPIKFYWGDCGDNTISSVDGEVSYASDNVYEFEGTEITDSTFGFPTYFGVQPECWQEGTEEPTMVAPHIDFTNGGITILCASACCGIYTGGYTGNTDCDLDGRRNLADITRLIDRVYVSKEMLCCELNGNVDGDEEGKINLSDITRLIDHVYVSKDPTEPCE